MIFVRLYSKKILSLRQKILLYFAVSVCVVAFIYTYLAAEYITRALFISIADNGPHVRLFIPESKVSQIPEMLSEVRKKEGVLRADSGFVVEKEYYIVTRGLQREIGVPGEVYYSGTKKFQFVAYPFDSETYIPPILMENVYSTYSRDAMERRPGDEPTRIITDPSEIEQRENWVIIDKNLNDIFPLGPSAFGDLFELHYSKGNSETDMIPLRTAGFLSESPLQIATPDMVHTVYLKPAILERFTTPDERCNIIDISLQERSQERYFGEIFRGQFGLERVEFWTDRNVMALPFLDGLRTCAYVGAFAIVVLSIVGVFIIVSMLILDKTRQLAIVYAIGLEAFHLRLLFVLTGIRLAIFALVAGFSIGFLAAWLSLDFWMDLVQNFCTVPEMPLVYSTEFLLIFAILVFLLCLVATWFPTKLHVSQDPIQNLRNE